MEPRAIWDQLLRDKAAGTLTLPGASQAPEDIEAWERFLAEVQPAGLLEFGTHTGSFSRWLAERVGWFRTLDIHEPEQPTPGFKRWNVWDDERKIRRLIRRAPRPFVLFCDNGNKTLEVQAYAPSLRQDDYLAVHDLGVEIHASAIPPGFSEVLVHGLTGFYLLSSAEGLVADVR